MQVQQFLVASYKLILATLTVRQKHRLETQNQALYLSSQECRSVAIMDTSVTIPSNHAHLIYTYIYILTSIIIHQHSLSKESFTYQSALPAPTTASFLNLSVVPGDVESRRVTGKTVSSNCLHVMSWSYHLGLKSCNSSSYVVVSVHPARMSCPLSYEAVSWALCRHLPNHKEVWRLPTIANRQVHGHDLGILFIK